MSFLNKSFLGGLGTVAAAPKFPGGGMMIRPAACDPNSPAGQCLPWGTAPRTGGGLPSLPSTQCKPGYHVINAGTRSAQCVPDAKPKPQPNTENTDLTKEEAAMQASKEETKKVIEDAKAVMVATAKLKEETAAAAEAQAKTEKAVAAAEADAEIDAGEEKKPNYKLYGGIAAAGLLALFLMK